MAHDFLHLLYSDVFKALGIEHLNETERNQVLNRLSKILEQRLFVKIALSVPESHQSKLVTLLTDQSISNEMKIAFIHNHIPNFIDFLEEEIASFKRELGELAAQTQ
ncbi:hypothetical protein HY967_01130 [Candidatus Jorgensenbacteria bacterium]|nr:hypothetical protein [Candidatus Jorgensenbacteria bacterium]